MTQPEPPAPRVTDHAMAVSTDAPRSAASPRTPRRGRTYGPERSQVPVDYPAAPFSRRYTITSNGIMPTTRTPAATSSDTDSVLRARVRSGFGGDERKRALRRREEMSAYPATRTMKTLMTVSPTYVCGLAVADVSSIASAASTELSLLPRRSEVPPRHLRTTAAGEYRTQVVAVSQAAPCLRPRMRPLLRLIRISSSRSLAGQRPRPARR